MVTVKERKVRFPGYDRLSEAGKALLEKAVEQDWTLRQTQVELMTHTEDKIANGSLGRWMQWRREQKEREKWAAHQVHALTAAIKQNDLMAVDTVHALAVSGLLEQIGQLHSVPPDKLMKIVLGFNELQQKTRALDQKDRELERLQVALELEQRKTEALVARAKALREQAKEAQQAVSKSKDLTDEQKQKIREMYGLVDEVGKAA